MQQQHLASEHKLRVELLPTAACTRLLWVSPQFIQVQVHQCLPRQQLLLTRALVLGIHYKQDKVSCSWLLELCRVRLSASRRHCTDTIILGYIHSPQLVRDYVSVLLAVTAYGTPLKWLEFCWCSRISRSSEIIPLPTTEVCLVSFSPILAKGVQKKSFLVVLHHQLLLSLTQTFIYLYIRKGNFIKACLNQYLNIWIFRNALTVAQLGPNSYNFII